MEKRICNKAGKEHVLIKVLGIITLSLLSFFILINIAGAPPFAYIPNSDSKNVTIIDITNNTIVDNVTVGIQPFGVAVTPDGKKVYVTNQGSRNVSVIDTITKSVTNTINVGLNPRGVAVTPDGTKVYVANVDNGNVSIIDTTTNTVIDTITVGSKPNGLAISPDGKKAYVTNAFNHNVSIIDIATNTVEATVNVGQYPYGVAVTPDGTKVYVTNSGSNNVSVIDTVTKNVTNTINVGDHPIGVAVTPDGTKIYVTNFYIDNISIIDISTNIVTSTVTVGSMPLGVSVTSDGTKVYVANANSNTVSVIDIMTNSVVATVAVGKMPIAFGKFIASSAPVLTLTKFANPTNYSTVGENITYNYSVTNSGSINILGSVNITDNKTGTFTISNSELAPGQNVTGTINYTVTQTDLDNGSITNEAFAIGISSNTEIKSNNVTTTVIANQIPALLTVKIASPTNYSAVMDTITYTYNVTNIGNVYIAGPIKVADNRTGSINITDGNLAPGKSANGIVNYTITQEDLDNGSVVNEAFAKGMFNGIEVNSTNVIQTVIVKQDYEDNENHPAISIFKTVISPDENGDCIVNSAGDTIPYRIVVKNEGNVDLAGVKIDDPLISLPKPDGDYFDPEVLNPGETWLYTGVYKLTSKDVKNKDSIKNTATVSCNELPEESSTVETPIVKKPGLTISKSVTGIDETGDKIINEPGDIIEYQVAVKNNGNMDLTEVSVSDPMVELTGPKGSHHDQETLSPAETWVYTGDYEVTQEDIDNIKNGHSYIKNTATVSCDELPDKSSSYVLPIYALPVVPPVSPPIIPPEIIIPGPENEKVLPEANFLISTNGGKCPLSVQFTDLSQDVESRSWDFNNDGTADSYDMNPSYVYTVPGTYTAKLTVTNLNGTDYETATIKAWQADSSGSKRNGHHGTGTGKAVIIRKNTVSDSSAGTGENGALADNQNGYPGSKQDGGNIVKNINPTSEQKGNTSSPANESEKTPGFEIICGIIGLLAVYLYGRK